MSDNESRRHFLLALCAGITAAACEGLSVREARAADKPRLDPDSERARGLSYTHHAASIDDEAREESARCANCTHYRGEAGDQWAPCNIFPEHLVNADGWCKSWFSSG